MKLITTILIICIILFLIYNLSNREKYRTSERLHNKNNITVENLTNKIIEFVDTASLGSTIGSTTGSGPTVDTSPLSGLSSVDVTTSSGNTITDGSVASLNGLSGNNPLQDITSLISGPPISSMGPSMGPSIPPSMGPSSSESNLPKDIDLDVKFSLKLNYNDYIKNDKSLFEFKTIIQNDICTMLSVSPYRIVMNDISIGSIIIRFTIKKTIYDDNVPKLPNDSIFSLKLYELFEKFVKTNALSDLSKNSPMLNIDIYTVTIDKSSNNLVNINNIIPKQLSFIEKLIKNKTPFKMYTLLNKSGIYPSETIINPSDNNKVKLYLTVNNKK